ncbi:MAG: hypothetical protein ACK6DC_20965, partial [Planctomycetota bacterium]
FWNSVAELCSGGKKLTLACASSLPNEVGRALGHKPSRIRNDKSNDARLPKTGMYWEANRIASMRRSWRELGCRVAVDFSSDVIWLDITAENGQRVFSGDWDIELTRDGKKVDIDVAWEEVCWFADDDVDYLELESDLEETCKIQRQIMLMREEGMVFMADTVLSSSDAKWDLRTHWTLASDIAFSPETKTNEGALVSGATDEQPAPIPHGLLLPLGLPEWRRGTRDASLACEGRRLTLRSAARQKRIYSPLVVALRGVGRPKPYTWRPLTVAQDLEHSPVDVAQGHRVQIGKDQWVFYRSLGPVKRRSIMGLHLNTEFYAARFLSDDGSYEALVEVSAD